MLQDELKKLHVTPSPTRLILAWWWVAQPPLLPPREAHIDSANSSDDSLGSQHSKKHPIPRPSCMLHPQLKARREAEGIGSRCSREVLKSRPHETVLVFHQSRKLYVGSPTILQAG
jgi:hypothetical protein